MMNVTLFIGLNNETNFDVSNVVKEDDGTITAILWCTHGSWEGLATFYKENKEKVKVAATGNELEYDNYKVIR